MDMNMDRKAAPAAESAESSAPAGAPPGMKFPPKHHLLKKTMGGIQSPTDQVMSPATQKVEAKRKHLLHQIKPKFLGDQFATANDKTDS
ncbi:hypothetical protein BC829DRAFT_401584 [Chytridium lagenaria]|nr:hypothetical protein BC829DRAFT_401584 [Chytridium lagenaria]